ncbi:esterase [Lonsdalea quercina]|uniref:esterase n=1 Tax=Lonsdalea quercina TaxID=71657 RepID=UPI0039756C23
MVEISVTTINGIEALHATPSGKQAASLPTVFFFHGFTSSKEVYAYFAYALAHAGFRVVAPDAPMHGARFDGDEARRLRHFWDIFQQNVRELPEYVVHFRQLGLIEEGRIGVCGASLGGMTALASMTQYPWINVVAAFMGSGYVSSLSRSLFPPVAPDEPQNAPRLAALAEQLAPFDVGHQLDKVSDRPLLLWHGLADTLVPAGETERLYQALAGCQRDANVTYLTEADIGHKITPTALRAGTRFFRQHL